MSSFTVQRRQQSRRYKVGTACGTCRRRKVKCDGARPVCGRCQRKTETRETCTYIPAFLNHSAEATCPTFRSEFTNPPTAGVPVVSETQPAPDIDVHIDTNPSQFSASIKSKIYARLGLPTTQKKCPILLANAPLFGELSLPRAASTALDQTDNVLPPRRHADLLADLYWEHIQPLGSFLDHKRFMHAYQALFAGSDVDCDEQVFTSILNLVFALSTQLQESVPEERRNEASNSFFLRAWRSLPLEAILWHEGSLELTQCLLLMTQYLRCTRNLHQTWMTLGLTVRMAQSLGLDKAGSSFKGENERLGRDIWQQCLFMERDLSYSLGRSSMMSITPLSLIYPRGCDCVDLEVKMHELGDIQGCIMHLQTPANCLLDSLGLISQPRHDSTIAVKLDERLNKLENGLPPMFHNPAFNYPDEPFTRRLLLLRLRIAHTHVLLHRPMLAQFCLGRLDDNTAPGNSIVGLEDHILHTSTILCINHVKTIITLLQQPSSARMIPWWYRIFYLHACMQHLIAAMLRPSVFQNTVPELWDSAVALLSAHGHLSFSARRCLASLRGMWEKVLNIPMRGQQGGQLAQEGFDAEFWDIFQHLGFDLGSGIGSPRLGMEDEMWLDGF